MSPVAAPHDLSPRRSHRSRSACGDDKARPPVTTAASSPVRPGHRCAESADESGTLTAPASDAPCPTRTRRRRSTGGNYDEAADLFAAYTRHHPDNPWGHYMYGLSAWKAGPHEQAIASFDEALRLDPEHRKSLLNSARVLLETGRPREALERVERAHGHRAALGRGSPPARPGPRTS